MARIKFFSNAWNAQLNSLLHFFYCVRVAFIQFSFNPPPYKQKSDGARSGDRGGPQVSRNNAVAGGFTHH